jgi:hypothetical protein
MSAETIDVEMAFLTGISSDRYLLEKVLDEGFHPELLRSATARLLAETLANLREQSSKAIDPILLKTTLEARGQFSPQVAQYLEVISLLQPPKTDQLLAYLDLLKDRQARQQLLELGSRLQAMPKTPSPNKLRCRNLQRMRCRNSSIFRGSECEGSCAQWGTPSGRLSRSQNIGRRAKRYCLVIPSRLFND